MYSSNERSIHLYDIVRYEQIFSYYICTISRAVPLNVHRIA